jgi:hypothetical protein
MWLFVKGTELNILSPISNLDNCGNDLLPSVDRSGAHKRRAAGPGPQGHRAGGTEANGRARREGRPEHGEGNAHTYC